MGKLLAVNEEESVEIHASARASEAKALLLLLAVTQARWCSFGIHSLSPMIDQSVAGRYR